MAALRVGYASMDITPPEGVELCGYGYFLERKNKGVLDHIYARAVALENGNERFLIINCDLEGVPAYSTAYIENALEQKLGLSREHMLLACIHTHSGPAIGMLCGCGEPDEHYAAQARDKIIEAGMQAFDCLKTVASLRAFDEKEESLGHNRAVKGGPADESVRGLLLELDDGQTLALVSHGCHPVTAGKNDRVSADYPGYVVRELAQDGMQAVYLCGFCGDINPKLMGSEDCPEKNGKMLADVFRRAFLKAQPVGNMTLSGMGFDTDIALVQLSCSEIEEKCAEFSKHGAAAARAAGIWAYVNKMRVINQMPPREAVHVRFIRIGNVLLVGFSAEMTIELAQIIKCAFPSYMILHMGNLFDTRRYISTKALVQGGGYEGYSSTFAYANMPITAGAGEAMVEESCRRAQAAL